MRTLKTALVLISYFLVMFLLTGCASSKMTTTKTLTDGTVIKYEVKVDIMGQDLTGTDLAASLNPDGKTTIKAGAVNTQTSQVTADVAASMVEMLKLMLPYLAVPATP